MKNFCFLTKQEGLNTDNFYLCKPLMAYETELITL